jgi:glutathione S-transferase
MTPTPIILHHYDESPFTQKALRMLGIKGLGWRSVVTPMLPPKDDLLALTGGYRGTPVMQIGADVYIDTQLIARELERRWPTPSLFPNGNRGLPLALVKWSDAFFRSSLVIALALLLPQWPEEFRRDRQQLFPDIDFDKVPNDLGHAKSQFRAHAWLLEQQLADGRAFLAGAQAGLADVQAQPFIWMARGAFADVAADLLEGLPHLPGWYERVSAIGDGQRTVITAQEALQEARSAQPGAPALIDARDAQGLQAGYVVDVMPDDTRRGAVRGAVHVATANEIAIRREHPRAGEVIVHFPRLGYRVVRVS